MVAGEGCSATSPEAAAAAREARVSGQGALAALRLELGGRLQAEKEQAEFEGECLSRVPPLAPRAPDPRHRPRATCVS